LATYASRVARRRNPEAEPAHPPDIDLGWLGGTVGFYLRTAQEAAFQAFARKANGADARPWRFAVLALIDANPGLTQRDLAAALRRNTSSLTPVLDELYRQGYVTRERVESDRRAYRLGLTPAGRTVMKKLLAAAVDHERQIDRLVGRTKRAAFIRTLQQIIAGLSRQE
jgi:DNA-binding MarR family transcriptional regulator